MKRILLLIALSVSSVALAQEPFQVARPAGTPQVSGTPGVSTKAAVDKYGNLNVNISNGASGPTNTVNVVATPGATSFLVQEDAVNTNGQTGTLGISIRSDAGGSTAGSDGDYAANTQDSSGNLWTAVTASTRALNPYKIEDTSASDGAGGIAAFLTRNDSLVLDIGSNSEYGFFKGDTIGRLITTQAPAGETWQSCGTATAVTSDVAIKASVASNRIYVTDIDCKNTSTTVGPNLDFKDGSTVISVGAIAANSATGVLNSSYVKTFTVPRRLTSATAFNFATNTATSSVTCCAGGYISVN